MLQDLLMNKNNNVVLNSKKFIVGTQNGKILYSFNGLDFVDTNAPTGGVGVCCLYKCGLMYLAGMPDGIILNNVNVVLCKNA